MDIPELLSRHKNTSDQISQRELRIILFHIERVLLHDVPGAIVEFGCYNGMTSLFIQRVLEINHADRPYHVYDSFDGLPQKTAKDHSQAGTQFTRGELRATKAEFIKNFRRTNLRLPHIHKGWFDQLSTKSVPEKVAFAFLDGDFYESIKVSLDLIAMKLSPGAIIIIDDYASEALPGVQHAVSEWLRSRRNWTLRVEASLAIITVPGYA